MQQSLEVVLKPDHYFSIDPLLAFGNEFWLHGEKSS
jgi:hypothetical protein